MNDWKVSCYTTVVEFDGGEILLHNSFMGAVAKIPAALSEKVQYHIANGINKMDREDVALNELCQGGFFVPCAVDERKLVEDVLAKERNFGFGLTILPHENCNFRCVYCYEKFERGKMETDVVAGLKQLVQDKASEVKNISVAWFGGEPLLAKEVIYELSDSFISSCRNKDIPYRSSITTNGYLLNEQVAEALLQREVRDFQITLDGPAHIHNQMRKLANGHGTYEKIVANLTKMKQRSEAFQVRLRINFNETIFPMVEAWFKEEIAPRFAGDSRFELQFHPIGKWGGVNDAKLGTCDPEAAARFNRDMTTKTAKMGFSDRLTKESLKAHGNVCYAARENSIVVGADGTLYKCTVALTDERNKVGTLKSDGQIILNCERWEKWVGVDEKDTTWCQTCAFYPTCQSRKCPLAAMESGKPPCPMTKGEYEALVKAVAFGGR